MSRRANSAVMPPAAANPELNETTGENTAPETPPDVAAPETQTPPDAEIKHDDGSFDTQPPNNENMNDGVGDLKGPSMDGVNPNAPTPPAPTLPQAQHKPRKGGNYYEIKATDAARLKEKDDAVKAGKRVEKVGSGYGAVYRIYM